MEHDAGVINLIFLYILSVFANAVYRPNETAEMWISNEDEPEENYVMRS
jgi:hypothetical protein